eukprot:1465955-Pleurochrysis_carterae.AAC.1
MTAETTQVSKPSSASEALAQDPSVQCEANSTATDSLSKSDNADRLGVGDPVRSNPENTGDMNVPVESSATTAPAPGNLLVAAEVEAHSTQSVDKQGRADDEPP